MPHDPALLEFLIRIFSIIAAIFATSCPVIYSFSPWWSTPLGRVVMLQAVSFALFLDLIVLFKFLEPASSSAAFFAVRTIMYGMIGLATGSLTYMIWRLNHNKNSRKEVLMRLSNQTYDRLKFIALVALPAIAIFYGTFAELWDLGFTKQIVGTIVAIDTLLGALLQISSNKYQQDESNYDGTLSSNGEDPDTGIPNLTLSINKHPAEVLSGAVARLKVVDTPK